MCGSYSFRPVVSNQYKIVDVKRSDSIVSEKDKEKIEGKSK